LRSFRQVRGLADRYFQCPDHARQFAKILAILEAAITVTSGAGFSLKQENIGYAAGAEIPCVIVNVMGGGPSTGMPTRPGRADLMQARWGSHGDYPIIVLTPGSVREIFEETMRAFDLAEIYRSPDLAPHYQIVLTHEGSLDCITVEVEIVQNAPADDAARARKAAEIRHHVKSMIGVTCSVLVQKPGAVPRSEGKAVRVKDLRKKTH
jgi:pyruvate/2-oxoacid:ferredoxin oxidoreductase alpha subunit